MGLIYPLIVLVVCGCSTVQEKVQQNQVVIPVITIIDVDF